MAIAVFAATTILTTGLGRCALGGGGPDTMATATVGAATGICQQSGYQTVIGTDGTSDMRFSTQAGSGADIRCGKRTACSLAMWVLVARILGWGRDSSDRP